MRGEKWPSVVPSLFRLEIAPFGIAIESAIGAQRFEVAHDLASVAAADGAHQLLEKLWPIGERGLDRGEALALVTRRRWHAQFEPGCGADRPGQVKARLGADAAAHQRRIDRDG